MLKLSYEFAVHLGRMIECPINSYSVRSSCRRIHDDMSTHILEDCKYTDRAIAMTIIGGWRIFRAINIGDYINHKATGDA